MDNTRGIDFEMIALGEPHALKPITQSNMTQQNYRRFAKVKVRSDHGEFYAFDIYTSYSAGNRTYWNYVVGEDCEALRCMGSFSPDEYTVLERAMWVCKHLVSQPEFWWPLS